jgi:hypothetical protein
MEDEPVVDYEPFQGDLHDFLSLQLEQVIWIWLESLEIGDWEHYHAAHGHLPAPQTDQPVLGRSG